MESELVYGKVNEFFLGIIMRRGELFFGEQ